MKTVLEELGKLCLEYAVRGVKNEYNGRDLLNASLIFNEVLKSLAYDNMERRNITLNAKVDEAVLIGTELRNLVLFATNIDLHDESNKSS